MKKLLLLTLLLVLTACGGGNGVPEDLYVYEPQTYETQPQTETEVPPQATPPQTTPPEPETVPTPYTPRPAGSVWTVANTWPGFGITSEEWVEDIIQFRNHVFAWHPKFNYEPIIDFPRNVAMGIAFDEWIDWLIDNVTYMSCFEVKVELQRALALLEDNHLRFNDMTPEKSFVNLLTRYRYPLEFRWFVDGIYLIRAEEKYSGALNYRLVAINNTLLDDIFTKFKKFLGTENIYDARNAFASYLNSPGLLYALGVPPREGQLTVYVFEGIRGSLYFDVPEAFQRVPYGRGWHYYTFPIPLVDSRNYEGLPLFLHHPYRVHWYTFIEEYGILYIRIHAYEIWFYTDFTQDIIRFIANNGDNIRATVVDARDNVGGDSAPHISNIFHRLVAATPEGKLFYFMNEGSRSASLIAALNLYESGAIMVGQPQGQIIDFYSTGWHNLTPPFATVLQNSGLGLIVPNRHRIFSNGNFQTADDLIFRPHILIEYTIYDWINNHDPYLEYVKNLLR